MTETNADRGSATITINASPEDVYAVVSDVTRTGEFSPECVRCEWTDGSSGPAAGARFHGYNNSGGFEWDVSCEVLRAEPGKLFEFGAGIPDLGENATIWTYTLEGVDGGTELTEAFYAPLVNVEGAPSNFPGRSDMLIEGCQKTLAAIKGVVEQ